MTAITNSSVECFEACARTSNVLAFRLCQEVANKFFSVEYKRMVAENPHVSGIEETRKENGIHFKVREFIDRINQGCQGKWAKNASQIESDRQGMLMAIATAFNLEISIVKERKVDEINFDEFTMKFLNNAKTTFENIKQQYPQRNTGQ